MSSIMTCGDCGTIVQEAIDGALPASTCIACGSTKRNHRLVPETGHIDLSPFAFQWYAKDFYRAYHAYVTSHTDTQFSPARLSLLAQAVELAAKSLHVHQGKRDADLRKLNHNLVKVCDAGILQHYGISLTSDEQMELQKMSDLNEVKAFEYFWFRRPNETPERNGILHAIRGRKGLPDETVIQGLVDKLLGPQL